MLYTAIPFGALLHHRLKQNQFFPFSKFYCLLLAYPLAVSPIHLKQTDFSTCCLPEAFLPSIQLRNPSQCSKAHLACAFCRGSSSGGSQSTAPWGKPSPDRASRGPALTASLPTCTFLHPLLHQRCSSCNHTESWFEEGIWLKTNLINLKVQWNHTLHLSDGSHAPRQPWTCHISGVLLRCYRTQSAEGWAAPWQYSTSCPVRHHLFFLVHGVNLGDQRTGSTQHPLQNAPKKKSTMFYWNLLYMYISTKAELIN